MKHLNDLTFWIKERERIRENKESGIPRPWTNDPILHTYRFCNVHREHDTVSLWIHRNWIDPHLYDHITLPFALCVARMVNHPDTLRDLSYPLEWDPKHFIMTLGARKIVGLKVWTSAYMITGGYSEGGESKEVIIARVLDGANKRLRENPIRWGDTLAEAAEKIKTPGIGTFLSAQIVADLKHSRMLEGASDWWTWCAPGPGSTAGLNYLHDRDPKKSIPNVQFQEEVNKIGFLIKTETGIHLDAQNVQNCLCEFSKYVRTKYYGGRPKSTYTPSMGLT